MKVKVRNFGGKTDGFKDKAEQNHEQKHLKAYIKGVQRFRDGFKTIEIGKDQFQRIEAWFPVKVIFGERNMTKKEMKKVK